MHGQEGQVPPCSRKKWKIKNGNRHPTEIHHTLSAMRISQDRIDVSRFLPGDVRVPEVPDDSTAQVRGLLRLLLVRDGFLPASPGKPLGGVKHLHQIKKSARWNDH
jgi:hypothetical protein